MHLQDIPFNVWLLAPTDVNVKTLRPVRVLDIYDSTGATFHPEGLFSIPTFGRIGSEERDKTFSYIDLKASIIHPQIFQFLIKLKGLYGGIMSGKQYAIWDDKAKDFIKASQTDAGSKTGYGFFMKHYKSLVITTSDSDQRTAYIEAVNQNRNAVFSKHLVMPAGLRDVEVDARGRTREDEINDLYRKLLTVANTIVASDLDDSDAYLDGPRFALQRIANNIYVMLKESFAGKRGWFQGKFGRRAIMGGSRNVITAMYTSSAVIGGPQSTKVTDTEIGFAQTLRGALPFTIHGLMRGILGQVFDGKSSSVWLVNRKSLKRELVEVSPDVIDSYGTRPGIEKLINRFFTPGFRMKPIVIGAHYLALIYVDDKHFKVFTDISELPEHLSKDNVHPLALADLLYTSTYMQYKKLVGTATRYPITGPGSIYPTTFKVRTTTVSHVLKELDDNWQEKGEEYTAIHFPQRNPKARWLDSLTVHAVRLPALGGD